MQQLADLRRCVDRLEAMHSYWQPVGTLLSADIMRGAEALGCSSFGDDAHPPTSSCRHLAADEELVPPTVPATHLGPRSRIATRRFVRLPRPTLCRSRR